jgi:hypothetical protein
MTSFTYRLRNYTVLYSKNGTKCEYLEGTFKFSPSTEICFDDRFDNSNCLERARSSQVVYIGNSSENNHDGLGGFIGENHDHFLWCGDKYPEIAIVKFDPTTQECTEVLCQQRDHRIHQGEGPSFCEVWVGKDPNMLFLRVCKGMEKFWRYSEYLEIGLELCGYYIRGATRKRFLKKRHIELSDTTRDQVSDPGRPHFYDISISNSYRVLRTTTLKALYTVSLLVGISIPFYPSVSDSNPYNSGCIESKSRDSEDRKARISDDGGSRRSRDSSDSGNSRNSGCSSNIGSSSNSECSAATVYSN